jgi:hypothetical protein
MTLVNNLEGDINATLDYKRLQCYLFNTSGVASKVEGRI